MGKFIIISCINNKSVIGSKNQLLYRLHDDLRNFKKETENNVVIMGMNTFKSLNEKPLPNRVNIIISHSTKTLDQGCIVVNSIDECIELCLKLYPDKNYYVIGGSSIYFQFLQLDVVSQIILTKVNSNEDGDAYFPSINYTDTWEIISEKKYHDIKYDLDYEIFYYTRKK